MGAGAEAEPCMRCCFHEQASPPCLPSPASPRSADPLFFSFDPRAFELVALFHSAAQAPYEDAALQAFACRLESAGRAARRRGSSFSSPLSPVHLSLRPASNGTGQTWVNYVLQLHGQGKVHINFQTQNISSLYD